MLFRSWAFNDELVARAIYDADIPIISAVGHEPDVTIADFVADVRAATPSHAAEIAVPDQGELREKLQSAGLHMTRAQAKRLELLRRRLEALASKRVLTDPMAVIQDKRMLLAHLQKNLGYAASARLTGPRQRLWALAASLDAMSPLKVLGRGFAMATDSRGQILRRAGEVLPGDGITVTLAEGSLDCRVENVHTEEDSHEREEGKEL